MTQPSDGVDDRSAVARLSTAEQTEGAPPSSTTADRTNHSLSHAAVLAFLEAHGVDDLARCYEVRLRPDRIELHRYLLDEHGQKHRVGNEIAHEVEILDVP